MSKKYCDDCNVTHTALMCFHKARVPIRPKKDLTWGQTKARWRLANPPDQYGYWQCYLHISKWCLKRVDLDQLSFEHVKPVGSHPDKKHDLNNIKASCVYCNSAKGSRSLEDLAIEFPHLAYEV